MAPKARGRSMSFVVNDATNVRVYVRVRPFNSRERDNGIIKSAVRLEGKFAFMVDVETDQPKEERFQFDECFWSNTDVQSSNGFSTQQDIYDLVGQAIIDNAFKGYHACLFAYGQTGSGKTFTMMGDRSKPDLWGMIPRLCNGLFERIEEEKKEGNKQFKVEVGYIEIYNEQLKDLLGASKDFADVKIRDHPVYGPTVEGNKLALCSNLNDINNIMQQGDHRRTVAATDMNAQSSRSHAVFAVMFSQKRTENRGGKNVEQSFFSKINLIDLAGSERVEDSGVTGKGFKEAININKSLTTLGRVMDALVELSQGKKGIIPPYRESVLTRTLQDSLGGNSKTMMFANVSPSPLNFEETLSTLRYSSRARNIVNTAKVNTQSTAGAPDMSAALTSEIDDLKAQLALALAAPKLQEDLDAAQADLSRVSGELGSVRSNLQQREAEVSNLESRVSNLETQKVELEEKAERLIVVEGDKGKLEREKEGLLKDRESLQAEVKRLKQVEQDVGAKLGDTDSELKRVKAELAELKQLHDSTKSKMQRQIEERDSALEDSKHKREQLEAQLRELQENFAKMKERAETTGAALTKMTKERDELLEENKILQARVKKQAGDITDLEAKVAAERKKSSDYLMNLAMIEDSVSRMGIKVPSSV